MSAGVCFVERQQSDSDKWQKFAPDVLPAWVADMDCAAAEPILRALQERLQHGVLGYVAPPPALAGVVAEYFLRRWQWQIEPDWLVYSPGLGAAIYNVCRLAQAPQDGVLTPQPIYHVFRRAPAIVGRRRVDAPFALDSAGVWRLPAAALRRAAAGKACGVFQLCNPHNPNGKVYTRAELEEIADFCLSENLIICADEVHADLILDEDKPHIPIASLSPEVARQTITLQSPSKAFNVAGLNFAVAVIPNKELREAYKLAARGSVIAHLNPFGYAAAAAAWGGACDNWLAAAVAWLRDNRDTLRAATAGIGGIAMPPLPSTYLAWLNVADLKLADAPAHFLRHGLGLSAGEDFGDKQYMRLNFACSPPRLQELIARLRAAAAAPA